MTLQEFLQMIDLPKNIVLLDFEIQIDHASNTYLIGLHDIVAAEINLEKKYISFHCECA